MRTPMKEHTPNTHSKSRIIPCKCEQFQIVPACAVTVRRSQGGTHDVIAYECDKNLMKHSLEQLQQKDYLGLTKIWIIA